MKLQSLELSVRAHAYKVKCDHRITIQSQWEGWDVIDLISSSSRGSCWVRFLGAWANASQENVNLRYWFVRMVWLGLGQSFLALFRSMFKARWDEQRTNPTKIDAWYCFLVCSWWSLDYRGVTSLEWTEVHMTWTLAKEAIKREIFECTSTKPNHNLLSSACHKAWKSVILGSDFGRWKRYGYL